MRPHITPVAAFRDNYIWLIHQQDGDQVFIVDPGDATPVLAALEDQSLTPAGILLTHHHPDHTGGLEDLLKEYDIPVYGPESRDIPRVSHPVGDGDTVSVFDDTVEVLAIPGHTLDHIAYYAPRDDQPGDSPLLFCGDTLFAAGCGRVFEGTAAMMYDSLTRLAGLPPETRVYCGHEYTLANLTFASAADPDNEALQQRLQEVRRMRDEGRVTLPSDIDTELRTNPFLRCHSPAIVNQLARQTGRRPQDETETFAALRQWKDNF